MIEGIDVSDVQGFVNWKKVKDGGYTFAFCKATDGETFVAKTFKRNWENIKSVGMIRGAYHFCHTKNDPIKEATHFVKTVGVLDLGDMLVLDIEDEKSILNNEQFINWTITFLDTVEQLTNVTPIVYTGGPYFDKHGGKPSDEIVSKLSKYPLWLAAYTTNPDKYVPYVWKNVGWSIWQRSGDVCAKGDTPLHAPGISVVVDRNQYKGTVEDLKSFSQNLYHPSKKIDPLNLIPIDINLQKNVEVIDGTVDSPLPVPQNFWDSILRFMQKIFGIK
jgi:lysozyme